MYIVVVLNGRDSNGTTGHFFQICRRGRGFVGGSSTQFNTPAAVRIRIVGVAVRSISTSSVVRGGGGGVFRLALVSLAGWHKQRLFRNHTGQLLYIAFQMGMFSKTSRHV